jgi:hypothetical protein
VLEGLPQHRLTRQRTQHNRRGKPATRETPTAGVWHGGGACRIVLHVVISFLAMVKAIVEPSAKGLDS